MVVRCTACAACVQHPVDHVSLMTADKDNDDDQKCAYAADNEEEEGTEKGEQEEGEATASITEDFGKHVLRIRDPVPFLTPGIRDGLKIKIRIRDPDPV